MIEQFSRWFFNQFDTLLVPTSEYMQLLKDRGYRHRHMELFRRGLRTEHFKPLQPRLRTETTAIRLLYVGRISKDKNLDFLIDTYRQIRSSIPDVSLTLAGTGPYLKDLQDNCSSLPNLNFVGNIPYHQLPQLYNEHDLFLFPSVTDTFGMVVLEAQACGLPALVSDIGGPKEIVRNGTTGYVIPVQSTQAWFDIIQELAVDLRNEASQYRALGQAARKRVEEHFSWDNILKEMVKSDTPPSVYRQRQQSSLKRILKLASNMMVH